MYNTNEQRDLARIVELLEAVLARLRKLLLYPLHQPLMNKPDLVAEVDNWQLKNVLMLQLLRDGMGTVKDLQAELGVPGEHGQTLAEGG